MSSSLSIFANLIESKVAEYLERLNLELDVSPQVLREAWTSAESACVSANNSQPKQVNTKPKQSSKISNSEKPNNLEEPRGSCESIIKAGNRKGEHCGKKISAKSKSGRYCGVHLKQESLEPASSTTDEKGQDCHIFIRNEYGNYSFGKTGLILKSLEEQTIIGKQTANGSIHDLVEEDIILCRRRRLDYVPNYHANLAKAAMEQSAISGSSTVAYTSKIPFLEKPVNQS